MTTATYADFEQRCQRVGYVPMNFETLCQVVCEATMYKFKRNYMGTWQYEVIMPGFGKQDVDKSKWVNITVWGRIG